MTGFIPAVVAEEEQRHRIESEEDEEEQDDESGYAELRTETAYERQRKHLFKQQRSHYLAAVAPRLEILQHLPFFIPFPTRVKIFREFVAADQRRRRGGNLDPDAWRAMIFTRRGHTGREDPRSTLEKHHAVIRRDSVFKDAYAEFYPLGEGLKEPIQITFVDKFGGQEAGIDGGGVTKEFLTAITKEAYSPDQHSLF